MVLELVLAIGCGVVAYLGHRWRARLARRLTAAASGTDTDCEMLLAIPPVRVEGKAYRVRGDLTMTAERFGTGPWLDREARDEAARQAEAFFGFEASLYFYAGIAHPDFGDVVFVYEPECFEGRAGTATTFDSGGMYLGFIKGVGLEDTERRRHYVKRDSCELAEWRDRAHAWVRGQFATVKDYLRPDGRPFSADPKDRLGHPENERRAWAFEIRLYSNWRSFERLRFAIVRQDFLQRALAAAGPALQDSLLTMIDEGRLHSLGPPHNHPCSEAVHLIESFVVSGGATA